jgi:hypothetical protein
MSFREYLHEKAEESRHNENTAYLMFLAGAVFFVGGMLVTLSLAENPSWFLLIPYYPESHAGAVLGLTLIISGISLIVFGIIAGINYSHDRGWYMHELRKGSTLEDVLLKGKSAEESPKKKKGKT